MSRALEEEECGISSVNLAETLTRLSDVGQLTPGTLERIDRIGLQVFSFDGQQAIAAAQLRAATRHGGLSLGDRACLALALSIDAEVLTADRAWEQLAVGVRIHQIR